MIKKKDTGKKSVAKKGTAPKKNVTPVVTMEINLPVTQKEKKQLTWDKRNLLIFVENLTDREARLFIERQIKTAHIYLSEFKTYPREFLIDSVPFYPTDFEDLAITINTFLNPVDITDQDSPNNYKPSNFEF